MIRELTIHGFKRFKRQPFDLSALTVLAGLNATGKTSVAHALILAREAMTAGGRASVRLNGAPGLELGTAEDVYNWGADGDILLEMRDDENPPATWRFTVPENASDALYLEIAHLPDDPHIAFAQDPTPRAFTYLRAERLGPRITLGAAALPAEQLEIGSRGEFSAQVLAALGSRPVVHSDRLHPERAPDASPLLKYEVERWLGEIVGPIEIDTEPYPGNLITALRFRAPGGEWVRAPNMGFGISYALPIVLGGLIAVTGGLLIVENPEAHLHPAGQSRIGAFLAWLAGKGVQTIVESHSDHVLNGIRRAIGEHGYLPSDEAIVHYFFSDESGAPRTAPLRFTASGGISDWPAGFFDQYQIDIAALGRVRRKR